MEYAGTCSLSEQELEDKFDGDNWDVLRICVSGVGILDFEMLNLKMKIKTLGPPHTHAQFSRIKAP